MAFQVFRDREGSSHLETTSQRVAYVADIRDNNLNLTCYSRWVELPTFANIWNLPVILSLFHSSLSLTDKKALVVSNSAENAGWCSKCFPSLPCKASWPTGSESSPSSSSPSSSSSSSWWSSPWSCWKDDEDQRQRDRSQKALTCWSMFIQFR